MAREYSMAAADPRWPAVAVLANVASQVTRALGWNAMFTESRIRFPLLVRIEFDARTGEVLHAPATVPLVELPVEVGAARVGTRGLGLVAATAVARALGLELSAAVLVLVAQQVLPQIPLVMMTMAGNSLLRDRSEQDSG
ncbi:hypothetical protein GCM10010330_46230 [Streptomyces tendae]|uniref:hypothetical protein n=1 Tax=Streptomyces tendae TaxID=1932 RepID=UPI0019C8E010|nr:hypothetical protein [Streptomyces tendae]GHA86659.1 hypothetical protein GCM10010330_46230 [Streptomyces tendae]